MNFPYHHQKTGMAWKHFVQWTFDRWHLTSTSYICHNHHNWMQYDKGQAKRLILKKDAVPTVYPANINITHPAPITIATVSTPVRPVF